ncbi:hypothetical protein ACODYM_29040 [Burkholderia gladioli]|uniref:hypothetical protein n=1 Tax=Burkholderia gladioli TaxID=28095 RepID=UPI003B51003C
MRIVAAILAAGALALQSEAFAARYTFRIDASPTTRIIVKNPQSFTYERSEGRAYRRQYFTPAPGQFDAFDATLDRHARERPAVNQITPAELARRLRVQKAESPYLKDVDMRGWE